MSSSRKLRLLLTNRIRRRRLLGLAVALAYMAVLAYVSLKPAPASEEAASRLTQFINALLHVPAYAVLVTIWIAVLRLWWWRASDWHVLLLAFLISTGYGVLLELGQLFSPGRYCNLTDMFMNLCGSLWPVVAVLIFPTRETLARERRQSTTETKSNVEEPP